MRILDRYIILSIVKLFFATLMIFCGLYILIDITSHLDEFIDRKVPINVLVQYYLSFFPIIISQTSSIACLISVLLTYSTLNNNNEVIAMRASGLNFWKITKPALWFGLIVSAAIFLIAERFVPQATAFTQKIKDENMTLEVDRYLRTHELIENLTFYGLKNRLYYVDAFDPKNDELHGITIIENDQNQEVREKTVALKGVWTGIAWKFLQCQVTQYGPGGVSNPIKVKVYAEKLMDIKETPEDFIKQRINVDAMNILELKSYINKFSNSGATKAVNNLRVDYHQKIAYPFGNFVIVIAGLPFALIVKSRKGMTFTSLGIAILIGFIFYVANAMAIAFGKGGALPPILAAWTTPILFVGCSLLVVESKF